MKRLALIDGGEAVFKVSVACQVNHWYAYVRGEEEDGWLFAHKYKKELDKWLKQQDGAIDPETKEHEWLSVFQESKPHPVHLVKKILESFVEKAQEDTEADEAIIVFGHREGHNFRNDVATLQPYKERPSGRPFHYDFVKSHLLENYHCYETELPYEDDDMLAIWYDVHSELGDEPIICSQDKDLMQVPGLHFNLRSRELSDVSVVQGLRSFYKQLYTGDVTDTIPGFYEITGKRKSTKVADQIGESTEDEAEMYLEVYDLYAKALEGQMKSQLEIEEMLLEIGNLLYLRRTFPDQGWELPA